MRHRLMEFTSFGIGGEAEIFPLLDADRADEALSVPSIVIGRGTNVLAGERIERRVVINRLCDMRFCGETVYAESGVTLARLSAEAAKRGLSGLEWAAGIPGSLGGGIVMNAGAFGGQMADIAAYVDVLRGGKRVRLSAGECGFRYRGSDIAVGDFVLGAGLRLSAGERESIEAVMREYGVRRAESQPAGRSAGSVYKRADRPAGWYIERAGLKGERLGGAVVSEKHANFIINEGGATARDVLGLMERIEERVRREFGVRLEREIRIIGEV